MIVVAKVGTSSITTETGEIDESAIAKFCAEVVRPAAQRPPGGDGDQRRHRRGPAGTGAVRRPGPATR